MENPHATHNTSLQRKYSVNVWAWIIDDYVIRLHAIQDHVGGVHYTIFLEETLPLLLEVVPLHVHESMMTVALSVLHAECIIGKTITFKME
jgi:hypothetical protein